MVEKNWENSFKVGTGGKGIMCQLLQAATISCRHPDLTCRECGKTDTGMGKLMNLKAASTWLDIFALLRKW